MKRYHIKQSWRSMIEHEEGDWVSHSEFIEVSNAHHKSVKHFWQLYLKEADRVDRLKARIVALFSIVAGAIAYVIVKLISWSLGL